MKQKLIILFCLSILTTKAQDISGGIDLGASYTNFTDSDSLEINPSFSPVLGFTVNRLIVPKLYLTVSPSFTLRNGLVISPSKRFRSVYLDWRLGLKYKLYSTLSLESGLVVSQFLSGRVESGFISSTLSGVLQNQITPYIGTSFVFNKYTLNARYHIPLIVYSSNFFSGINQFNYGDLTLTIPITGKGKNDETSISKKEQKTIAAENIKELKNGILLIALCSSETKQVKDKEVDNVLVSSFEKHYTFSRYFVVDESSIDSLITTGKISVYDNYPFLSKQTIDLTSLSWFYTTVGKNTLNNSDNKEVFEINGIFIYDAKKEKLKSPFPFYMPVTGGSIEESVKSLNSELDKFYYQTVFGM
jgi:hypothetical protein